MDIGIILPFFLFAPPTASLLAGEWLLVGSRAFLVFQTLFVVLGAFMLAATIMICGVNSRYGDPCQSRRAAVFASGFYGFAYFLPTLVAMRHCEGMVDGTFVFREGMESFASGFEFTMRKFLPEIIARIFFLVPNPPPGWYPNGYLSAFGILCVIQAIFFLIAVRRVGFFRRAFASKIARSGLMLAAFFPLVNVMVLPVTRGLENKTLTTQREPVSPPRLNFALLRPPMKVLAASGTAAVVLCAALASITLLARATEAQEATERQMLVVRGEIAFGYVDVCYVICLDERLDYCRPVRRETYLCGPDLLNSRIYTANREYGMQLSEEQMNRVTALAEAAYAREAVGGSSIIFEFPHPWVARGNLPQGDYAVSYKGEARALDYGDYFHDGSSETPELWELIKYVVWELDKGQYLLDTTGMWSMRSRVKK